eukprot:1356458-Pleurochrysis_carterae.AAC.1
MSASSSCMTRAAPASASPVGRRPSKAWASASPRRRRRGVGSPSGLPSAALPLAGPAAVELAT